MWFSPRSVDVNVTKINDDLFTQRLKDERIAKENPQKSKGESHEMSLKEISGSKENKYYENCEQESNREILQPSHYQELEINKIPHDPDYLYPDLDKDGFYQPLQFNDSTI